MLMPPCRVLSLTRADIPGQRERGEQWENDGHFEGWEENRRNLASSNEADPSRRKSGRLGTIMQPMPLDS